MTWSLDARIPVIFGTAAQAGADDAVLELPPLEQSMAAVRHAAGCACCVPRSAVADILARMFLRRARGEGAFFRRVIVVAGAETAAAADMRAALATDPLLAARYRLG